MANGRSQKSEEPKEERTKPIFSRRMWTGTGSVEVAIFEKSVESDKADFRVFNVVCKRVWKSEQGYESGNSFRPEDLGVLAVFVQEALLFIANEQSKK